MPTHTDRLTEIDDAAHLRETGRQFANMRTTPAYGTAEWHEEVMKSFPSLRGGRDWKVAADAAFLENMIAKRDKLNELIERLESGN